MCSRIQNLNHSYGTLDRFSQCGCDRARWKPPRRAAALGASSTASIHSYTLDTLERRVGQR